MINETYKAMLQGKSVIRELSEYATARGARLDMKMYLITALVIRAYLVHRIIPMR